MEGMALRRRHMLSLGLRTWKDLLVVRCSLSIALVTPWRRGLSAWDLSRSLTLGLAHNPNLLPSPPLPFPPVDEFKRFGFKIPIFPLTAGNYSNDSRSAGCAVYTLFTSRSSVVGCVSSVIKFREKAFKKISFFLSSIVLPLWHGCSQQFPRAG